MPSKFGGVEIVEASGSAFGGVSIGKTPEAIDTGTGAPVSVRAAAGNIPVENQLATIQQFFPDAEPFGEGNFVFTNPKTGQPTLFNPKGLDRGDIAQHARAFAETLGGAVGGAGAFLAGQIPPAIATPEELVTVPVAIGIGSSIGGQIYDRTAEFAGRIDPKALIDRFTEASSDVLLNAIAPEILQKLGIVGQKALEKTISPIRSKLAGKGSKEILGAFEQSSIQPTAGAVSGNKAIQGAEEFLSKTPTGARTIQKKAAKTLEQTSGVADKIAEMFGPVKTKEGIGGVLRKGSTKAVETLKKQIGRKEEAFTKAVGEDTLIPVNETIQKFREIFAQFEGAETLGSDINKGTQSLFDKVLKDAAKNDGRIPLKALRALRSELGANAKSPLTAPIKDVASGKASALYGAITNDIKTAVKNKSPELSRQFDEMMEFEASLFQNEFPLLEKIIKSGYDSKAYKAALSTAKDGGEQLKLLRKSLTPEEWDIVAGSVFDKLGKATAGKQNITGDQFSVGTFLTEWNKLAPEAKDVLFRSGTKKSTREDLDNFLTVIGSLKDVEAVANYSGTGMVNNFRQAMFAPLVGGAAGGIEGAAAATIGQVALPFGMARLITNPRFVRWLANGSKISPRNDLAVKAHIKRLVGIGFAEPEIKEELRNYSESLKGVEFKKGGDND